MKITSPAFADDGRIPAKYTCDGEDMIPPLAWDGVPPGARTLALIVDDPDAPRGVWDHWLVYNVPPTLREVREGQPPPGVAGRNSWGNPAWGGPCPPSGEHRYVFRLFALDADLPLASSATRAELEKAMRGHVLGSVELVGRYRRPGR